MRRGRRSRRRRPTPPTNRESPLKEAVGRGLGAGASSGEREPNRKWLVPPPWVVYILRRRRGRQAPSVPIEVVAARPPERRRDRIMGSTGSPLEMTETPEGERVPVRWRAVLLGLLLAAVICVLTPFNNVYRGGTLLGGGHFPLAPFVLIFWITVFTALAGRVAGLRRWLTGREVLVIWVMMVLVSGIAYTGLARTLFVNLSAPYHFATVGNQWETLLHPHMPDAWYPRSPEAVKAIYNGLPGGREMGWGAVLAEIPWGAWIMPLAAWGGFTLLCFGVILCLVNLMGRQWIHHERMNLPLLRVPQLMSGSLDEGAFGRFMTDRFLLAGLLVPVFLHLLNGLHFYFPAVPQIPTLILAGPYFPKFGLFSGFHKLKIHLYPAFIGFAFLASRQISLSFWLFFLAGGLLMGLLPLLGYAIPAAALGVTFGPTLSRPEETQMMGAYGVFFLFILWLARHHLAGVVRQALGRERPPAPRTEWFSLRLSFWGAVAGIFGIVGWLCYFGMSPVASVLVVGAFFMVMVVASRVICQGGVAYFTLTAAPVDGLLFLFGPGFFGPTGILLAGVVQKVLFLDLRESLMPSLFHASAVTQPVREKRRMAAAMVLALVTGVAVSMTAMLALCYRYGIRELQLDWATRTVTTVYGNIAALIETPVTYGGWVLGFSVAGALVMALLLAGYHRFPWWPIHPIGYLMTYSSAMRILWFSFFAGWLCNALCMRYGGVVLFKRLRYFFAGLIIGDFLMGGVWAVVGLFTSGGYLVLPD